MMEGLNVKESKVQKSTCDNQNYNYQETRYVSLNNALKDINKKFPISMFTLLRYCGYYPGRANLFKENEINIVKKNDQYLVYKKDLEKFLNKYEEMINLINERKYLPISEYAEKTGVSRRTVERRIKEGKLKSCFYNKQTYIKMEV